MASALRCLLLVAVFFATTLVTVDAIRCYVCESAKDSRCGDPFADPEDLLVTCAEESAYCGKKNSSSGTSRFCTGKDGATSLEGCVTSAGQKYIFVSTVCNQDKCNGSEL